MPNASLQGVAVGVPGMVRGTAMAVEQYGRLTLAQVLQPAIQLADEGFAATPRFVSSPNCTGTSPTNRATNSPAVGRLLLPRRPADPGRDDGHQQAARRDLPPDRDARPGLLLQADMPDKGCDIALGIVEGQKWNRPQAPTARAAA